MLILCPECQKPVSEAAPACPACGFTLSADIVEAQKVKKRESEQGAAVVVAVIFGCLVLLFLIFSGVFSPSGSSSPATSPAFANDKERLEWRSQHNVPMNDEDIRYEQRKLMEAAEKIKASEYSVGH